MDDERDPSLGPYDALLLVSFGGPEGPADVLPFLRNVTRGRDVPEERLAEVAAQYERVGGRSPLNRLNRELLARVLAELERRGRPVPGYLGNRNWHPFLADTVQEMADAGVRRALAVVTSAFSSYSSCRQYRDDIETACAAVGLGPRSPDVAVGLGPRSPDVAVGLGPRSPDVDIVRPFFNHPGFVAAQREVTVAALQRVRAALGEAAERPGAIELAFCAHSIPVSMAERCDYVEQLHDVADQVVEGLDQPVRHHVVYQSRSGPPHVPWLEPDVRDHVDAVAQRGAAAIVLVPVGFVSDHVEVGFDLDTAAAERAAERGLHCVRAATVGATTTFVTMVADLVEARADGAAPLAVGRFGPRPEPCAEGCCPAPVRPPSTDRRAGGQT